MPPLTTESHPIICPSKIVAYRVVSHKGGPSRQVLVEWNGMPKEHRSWEEWDYIQRLVQDSNLKDKIVSDGQGDVTEELDPEKIITQLREDLNIVEIITD